MGKRRIKKYSDSMDRQQTQASKSGSMSYFDSSSSDAFIGERNGSSVWKISAVAPVYAARQLRKMPSGSSGSITLKRREGESANSSSRAG